jgi:hypothetical protein
LVSGSNQASLLIGVRSFEEVDWLEEVAWSAEVSGLADIFGEFSSFELIDWSVRCMKGGEKKHPSPRRCLV